MCYLVVKEHELGGGGDVQLLSHVQLSGTSWTVALQAPLSMGFPRHEYCSGLPFLSPGDLPHSGIEPMSPALTGVFFTAEPPGTPLKYVKCSNPKCAAPVCPLLNQENYFGTPEGPCASF